MAKKVRSSNIVFIDYYSNKRAKQEKIGKVRTNRHSPSPKMSKPANDSKLLQNAMQPNWGSNEYQQGGRSLPNAQQNFSQWNPLSETLYSSPIEQPGFSQSCDGFSPSVITNMSFPSFPIGTEQRPPTSLSMEDFGSHTTRSSLDMSTMQPFNTYGIFDQTLLSHDAAPMFNFTNTGAMRTMSTLTTSSFASQPNLISDIEPVEHIKMSDITGAQSQPLGFLSAADLDNLGKPMESDLEGFSCDSFLSLSDNVGLGSGLRARKDQLTRLDSGTSMFMSASSPISYCSSDLVSSYGDMKAEPIQETLTFQNDVKIEHDKSSLFASDAVAENASEFESVGNVQDSDLVPVESTMPVDFALHKPGTIVCFNCKIFNEKTWRKSPNGDTLCNACGLYEKAKGKPRPRHLAHRKLKRLLNREAQQGKADGIHINKSVAKTLQAKVSKGKLFA